MTYNVNLACFIAITKISFLNNWKWEILFEGQNIRWKHYIDVLNLLKLTIQHKTIIRFGLILFLFKSLNTFNLLAAIKSWITNYTFLVNSFMAEVPTII